MHCIFLMIYLFWLMFPPPQEAKDTDFGTFGDIENINLKMDPMTGRCVKCERSSEKNFLQKLTFYQQFQVSWVCLHCVQGRNWGSSCTDCPCCWGQEGKNDVDCCLIIFFKGKMVNDIIAGEYFCCQYFIWWHGGNMTLLPQWLL